MKYCRTMAVGFTIVLFLISSVPAEENSLHTFLARVASKPEPLSKKEESELLERMEKLLGQAKEAHRRMTRGLQMGEIDLRYQEGEFWRSKLKEDEKSIEAGMEQVKFLREKPGNLVASIGLYKTLKDLSFNFNAYNNMASFCAFVGDLAPELGLWADPVFYHLYLLPLARLKDIEKAPPPKKEKKPVSKGKKP